MNITNITKLKLLVNTTNCSNITYFVNFTNFTRCEKNEEKEFSIIEALLIILIIIGIIMITCSFFIVVAVIQKNLNNYNFNNFSRDDIIYEIEETVIEINSSDYNSYLDILSNSEISNTKKYCSICLVDNLDLNFKKLKCGHEFHEPCIELWFKKKKTCPICRSKQ